MQPYKLWMTIVSMRFALLDNKGYRHTLRICNTSCFCSATMAKRTLIIVTFIHVLNVIFSVFVSLFRSVSLHVRSIFFCLFFL